MLNTKYLIRNTMRKLRLRTLIALGLITVLFPIVVFSLYKPNTPQAAWFSESYAFRQKFSFTHNASITSPRAITVTFDNAEMITAGAMQSDCDDVRFTDINGKTLYHDLTSSCNNASATYEVIFNEIGNGANVGYIYYSNPSAFNAEVNSALFTALTPSGGDPAAITDRTNEEDSPGPIVYWAFDEGVDNTCSGGANDVCDNSQNGLDVDRNNDTDWISEDFCLSGKCLFFDGTNDYISRSEDDNLLDFSGSDAFTIQVWIRVPPSHSGVDQIINDDDNDGTDGDITINMQSDGNLQFAWDDDDADATSESLTTTGGNYADNKWHLVTAIKNGTTSANIYIDSVLVATDSSISETGTLANNDGFALGTEIDGTSNDFIGFMDEVKIYNYARSSTQINADFLSRGSSEGSAVSFGQAESKAFMTDGLGGYWTLNESSGNASDSSGNGLTLTNNGITTYVSGKFGNGSEHVPASSQYLNTATAITGVKTISFWTNPDSTTNGFLNLASGVYINASSGTISTTGITSANIYVNGTASTTLTQDVWQLVTITTETGITANAFEIGRANGSYYDGTLDDVRLYNRALSPNEVASLFNLAPAPVGYYPMDENTGTSTTYDRSGNAFNGTLTSITEDSWASGKFGSALSLDGTADFVDVGTGPTAVNTVAFWVYPETTTEYFLNLTSTTDYVWVNTGTVTATGLSSPTIYVNGVISSTLVADQWQHVAVVTSTSENASNLDIGRTQDANYLEGKIDDVRIYNYARTPDQVIEDMNAGHPVGGSPIGSQVAYWGFDEGYGTTANNQIAANSSVTGSISGATWFTGSNCKYDRCLDFDGTDDVTTVTNANAIDMDVGLSSGFSISTWFNADTDGEGDVGQIFQKGTNTYCRTDTETGGTVSVECNLDLATTPANVNITGVSTNAWHHLVLTYDDASKITVYIDGIQRGANTGSGATVADSANLLIGGTTTANFDGTIDDFKVYSSTLTASEVMIDMNANASINFGAGTVESAQLTDGTLPEPVGYWDFNEKSGTTAFDKGSGKTNGTLTGSMTQDDWVQGKVGTALDLDGSNDYVDVGTGPSTIRTVSFWVKPTTTSEHFIDLDGANYISASSGTVSATGFTSPTIYINGVVGTTITANTWQHITVTTSTAENATDLDLGRLEGTDNLSGMLDEVKIYSTALTRSQVAYDYNRGRPIAHWQFDECQGSTANDASGNGKSGTINPGDTSGDNDTVGTCGSGASTEMWNDGTTGKLNASLGFDGTNDYVEVTSPSLPTADYTYSAWFKNQSTGSFKVLLIAPASDGSNEFYIAKTGSEFLEISSNASTTTGTRAISTNTWYHVAVTRAGSSITMYLDGREYLTDTDATAYSFSTCSLVIGADVDAPSCVITTNINDFWSGQIDDVRVYNYALSASQIKKLINDDAGARFGPNEGQP